MEQHFSDLIIDTTKNVFKSMVFMDVSGAECKSDFKIEGNHVTALVGFAGVYVGLAAIHCSMSFARKIGAAMLQIEPDNLTNEDVRDALSEISNMISGHFKAELAKILHVETQVFEQSVPSVISGGDYETHTITDAPRYFVKFTTGNDSFYIELAMKKV